MIRTGGESPGRSTARWLLPALGGLLGGVLLLGVFVAIYGIGGDGDPANPGLDASALDAGEATAGSIPADSTASSTIVGDAAADIGSPSPTSAPSVVGATASADGDHPAGTGVDAESPGSTTTTITGGTRGTGGTGAEGGATAGASPPPTAAGSSTTAADGGPTSIAPTRPATRPLGPIDGRLFADDTNSAARWAEANAGDARATAIGQTIGRQPIARWFGDWNGDVEADVAAYVDRARAAGSIPMLVAYNIPDRDCGLHSAGGAADFTEYRTWIGDLADGLGDGPAYVLLEPDSIALDGCAGSDRNRALADAVVEVKTSCGQCRVYLDAGHSNWVAPGDMAGRLRSAGVLQADGFFSNVSNYNTTSAEQSFGSAVLAQLGNPSGLGQVIDTSRNGNGPPSDGAWCDPSGRAVGPAPTLDTGTANVHALLWIKVPGEADGCIAGAGQFVPDRAYELATS